MTDFKMVPVAEIQPDSNQPRRIYDEISMSELTQSIKEKGILQPILLRPNENGYILVCGERRYRASKEAGLSEIPSIIRHLSDDEALELQIIENLQRKDVHPLEEAIAFKSLIEKKQWKVNEIALRVGKKETYVRQRMKLADLVPEWQKMFYKNAFTIHEALQLCMLPEKQQKEFYKNEIDKEDEKAEHPKLSINSYRLEQYRGDLNKAVFDLADPTLDKKMGPCTTCQYNTACLMLFAEAKDSPRCMNVPCYKHKTDVYFDRELKNAKEDPEVILINNGSGDNALVQKLKKEGHQVLKQYSDYTEIEAPEKPDWEEYKDDYGDEDTPEQETRKEFEKEVDDYTKDFEAWQKKVSTGKYKKAFVVDGYSEVGKYTYIELKKAKAQTSAKAAVDSGKADISDIEEEINRIREREKRSKELDGEKIYGNIKEILNGSKIYTEKGRDFNLSSEEIQAATVALWEAGSMDYKKWLKKHLELNVSNYYSFSVNDYEKLNLTYFGLNDLILHFIKDKLITSFGSHLNHGNAAAIYKITKRYHPGEVEAAERNQSEVAAKRADRVNKKIAALQAQKKELQQQSRPATKKKVKK